MILFEHVTAGHVVRIVRLRSLARGGRLATIEQVQALPYDRSRYRKIPGTRQEISMLEFRTLYRLAIKALPSARSTARDDAISGAVELIEKYGEDELERFAKAWNQGNKGPSR